MKSGGAAAASPALAIEMHQRIENERKISKAQRNLNRRKMLSSNMLCWREKSRENQAARIRTRYAIGAIGGSTFQ